jgi:hypothetical protein
MKRFILVICISLLTPVVSWADIIFTLGNNPQHPGGENVLLNSGAGGSIVIGTLNQSGLLVNFTSIKTHRHNHECDCPGPDEEFGNSR